MCLKLKDEGFEELHHYENITLRMYLCCPVSNCSSQQSFSAIKRIKSYLRSRMADERRLNNIAILNIESEITKSLEYNGIVNECSSSKTCQRPM